MPKIGCRFLNFFLSTDDFSTCKENTVSLKYARDMNWSYKDDIDCLLFFFVSSVAYLCICFTLSRLLTLTSLIAQEHKVTLALL